MESINNIEYTPVAARWKGMWMLTRFYMPMLKPQLISYPIIVMFLLMVQSILGYLTGYYACMAFSWIVAMMQYFGPMALTRHDARFTSSMLPVTASQKLGFLLIYSWLVLPLLIMIPAMLTFGIFHVSGIDALTALPQAYHAKFLANMATQGSLLSSIIIGLGFQVVTFYPLIFKKGNRGMMMFLFFFVALFAVMFLAGLTGGIYGVYVGYTDAVAGIETTDIDTSPLIRILNTCFGILSAIVSAVLLIRMYKKLRNRGF